MSDYSKPPFQPSCNYEETSGEDLSGLEGRAVGVSSQSVTLADNTASFRGILTDGGSESGDPVSYRSSGLIMAEVKANSTNISEDDKLKVTTDGYLIKATAGDEYIGKACEDASEDEVFILVNLDFNGYIDS
jgi:hypothetical protein